MADVPLPHPVMNAMLGDDWEDLYTADQMRSYTAAVSAAKDAEIAGLRAELIKSLADNAALRADASDRQNNVVAPLRERVRVLEDARPEPDCRLCRNFCDCSDHGYLAGWCKEGNQYDPLPPVRLWRTT